MDPSREKSSLEKETEQETERTDLPANTQIHVSPPEEHRAAAAADLERDPEKDAIAKDISATATNTPERDSRHLSVDLDEQARVKRESVESRLSGLRDSSVLSISDFDELEARGQDGVSPLPQRPVPSRGGTTASAKSTASRRSMPPLRRKETRLAQKEAHPWQHLGITLGLPMILLFDLVVPCIVYYVWYDKRRAEWAGHCKEQYPNQACPIPKPEYDSDILGAAVGCFGIGELWILVARVWRLFYRREECAPLLSRNRWELDATSWVYGVAMILALIPFVVGADLEIPQLYLYAPSFIMGFLGILMVITTLCPIKIPIGINSHPRGSGLRPFIYYAAEDFIAVDGLQDREFRIRYNERYETNKMFRQFFLYLTLWWILGVMIYIGCVSAVIWTLEFHYAFGLSLGVLFSYIAIWAAVTVVWVNVEMKREHRKYEEDEIEA
ncbi:hypothetical protein DOTSEDRAFT_69692 [Lecanosticta acicola]|uniref:Uncharacterized protein n=1 Tax=Lecanosticta acicola TaxID=111012 RepID=A0AAI9E867_9PEZI|nr:hypothetical protein DOTSEDRAFT_69692 [Lecanosticta acicola]